MVQKVKRLPEGEREVMQIIWSLPSPVTRSEIEERLHKPLAPTTVLTLLTRLCEKGFLRTEKDGRSNRYTPLVEKRAYLAMESRSILNRLYGGSLGAFAAALCDSGITEDDLRELEALLRENRPD